MVGRREPHHDLAERKHRARLIHQIPLIPFRAVRALGPSDVCPRHRNEAARIVNVSAYTIPDPGRFGREEPACKRRDTSDKQRVLVPTELMVRGSTRLRDQRKRKLA